MRGSSALVGLALLVAADEGREFPFDFRTHQPIVQVRVNGGSPLPFLFDTGASINVIDEDVARDANIAGGGARTVTGGGQSTAQAQFAEGITFSAGNTVWERQRAMLVRLGYPKKQFAGFIGAPILMRYVVSVDFDAHVLRLIDPGSYTPPPGAVKVPFELMENLPVVHATVDVGTGPIDARLMVDTGAGDSFADLNRPFVDAHHLLDSIEQAADQARPAGIGGTAPFVYGFGKRFALGSFTFDRPKLGLSRATGGSSSRTERDGIIGNDLLRQFLVTFDYSRKTLVLQKPSR